MKTGRYGSVVEADRDQWRKWRRLSPSERIETVCRLWEETREFRKKARRTVRMAVAEGFTGVQGNGSPLPRDRADLEYWRPFLKELRTLRRKVQRRG